MSNQLDLTFDTPEPIDLYVENGRGTVDVTATSTTETTVRITGELTVAGEDDQRRFIRDLPVPKRNHPSSRTIQRQHMACHCLIFARKHADLRGKQRSGQRRLTVAGKSARARRT